jgi:hypothetical protein
MKRSVNILSSAVWPRPNPTSIRWTNPSIPPRAGESSTSRYFQTSPLVSNPSSGSRHPEPGYRDLHSTARVSAALPRRLDDYDDGYGQDYGHDHNVSVDWDDVPLHIPSGTKMGARQMIDPELEGVDFTSIPIDDSDIPSVPFEEYSYDSQPPLFDDSYDPTAKIKRKRRRRVTPNLPPLPKGELPPDGQSRFDWRETSLSSEFGLGKKKTEGDLWYPHLAKIKRMEAVKGKLEVGDVFRDEIERYENQYVLSSLNHGEY